MEHRGSYHPALDAYRRPENKGAQMNYTHDMCPNTLDILARTVFLGIHPDLKAADIRRRIKACRAAADALPAA